MKLIEAIEKGRARVDYWCRGNMYYDYSWGETEACAVGMAWLGTHDTDIHEISEFSLCDWMKQSVGLSRTSDVININDNAGSYEEMIQGIQDCELAELEINP